MIQDKIFNQARQESRTFLTEIESKELLKKANIPVIDTSLARSKKEALSLSKELGFPVALKIVSPDIVHKTDCGGVRLGIKNVSQVLKFILLKALKPRCIGSRNHWISRFKFKGRANEGSALNIGGKRLG